MNWIWAGIGSLLIGVGIAGMHYIGMAAMRLPAALRFNAFLVCLSVLSAIAFSFAAFLLAFNFREETRRTVSRRLASATIMGADVSAMYYIGMASASFIRTDSVPNLSHSVNVSTLDSIGIAFVTLILLGLSVFMCEVGRRLEAHAKELESRVRERTSRLTALNAALSESEARLREFEKVVEGLEEMVVVIDREYRYVIANRAFLRHRGLEWGQVVGHPLSELPIPGISETVVKEQIDRCFEGKVVKCELRYRSPHLGETDLFISYYPIEGSDGIDRIACILQDITERKRAEHTAGEWQKRLELAEKAGLPIGLWDLDLTANTLAWSEESYRQFGFTRDNFSGRLEQAVARIHPEDRPRVEEAIRRVRSGGTEFAGGQHRVVRPDGTISWIEGHGVVVRDGPTIHVLGIAVDITNLKKTEQSLQQAKLELARMARIATMAELAASIAHEINQPLAAAVANGSASLRWLALQPPDLDEARQGMTRAVTEANRASEVIARIRALLQKTLPHMERLDLNKIIREVLALMDNELLSGGIAIETELTPDLRAVRGDRIQLQQVLLNLIMNAIDAMSVLTGAPRKLIIRSAKHENGVLIQVQDSGTGVDPELIERIFEPFFTTKAQGIGIGLSFARSVVEAHGGHLWATSAAPHGAVFQVTLSGA
jgi:PAS domain S-box-containing protein